MDTEREAKSIIPFYHLAEVNERREAQAIKAAKARQAKNYMSPILTSYIICLLYVSYIDLETGTTVSYHVFLLFKYQILILM